MLAILLGLWASWSVTGALVRPDADPSGLRPLVTIVGIVAVVLALGWAMARVLPGIGSIINAIGGSVADLARSGASGIGGLVGMAG